LLDHQSVLNQYDAIIIGSGISGLTISLILAKEGQRVAIFERDRDIAPLIRPYKRNGFECSPGLHIIGWMDRGEVVSSFLDYLHVSDGVSKELNENGFGRVIAGTKQYHFPRGYDNVEIVLRSHFPDSAEAVSQYMRAIKEINEQTFYINHKLAPNFNTQIFGGMDNYTLKDFLKQYQASDEFIEAVGTFNQILMGSKADEVPFMVHAFVIGGYYQSPGCFTPQGIDRLLSNFKRELSRFGVDLFLNSEVVEISTGAERNVTGVKTANGGQYLAPNIIVSFNPKLLSEKIKPNIFRPVFQHRLEEAENTFSFYVAFYQLKNDKDIEVENFIYYNESRDIVLGAIINHSGENRILSVFLADPDQSYPPDIPTRKIRAEQKLQLLESAVYQNVPDLQGKIVLLDYLKPWSFERYTNAMNGSAYGIKHTTRSIGFQHRVPIHGLYLVGQAIYPGFLGSMISSFSLALELLQSETFWSRVINR
jgi:all-trans-retinol 13,14-reductase